MLGELEFLIYICADGPLSFCFDCLIEWLRFRDHHYYSPHKKRRRAAQRRR